MIEAEPRRCTGCRRCQLICSLEHTKMFNLSKARILIADDDQDFDITFTDDCDECGVCVGYCVYGALRFKQEA